MKNKKEVNIEELVLEMVIPNEILDEFIFIAEKEIDFVGEKLIENGYILKEDFNKIAATIQRNNKLYSAKLKYYNNENKWEFDGEVYRWENIEHLVQ